MLESLQTEELEYQKISQEEQQRRGILGRLVGVVADFMAPTRNGRHYSEELWEKVFDDPIMKERIENGVCFGELGHPADREETDIEKVAVVMPEVPKKNKDGKLTAVFDILNTPNGKILKALCDYGSTLGVSSRGSGDTFTDFDGNEEVEPDSYTCQGFDIVLIPAVESARLKYVTESLDTGKKKSLKESLQDTIDKASEEDKKVMEETINDLGIDLNEAKFGGFSYKFGVHAHPQGRDIILGGSKTLEGAEQIAINQVDELLENPWMSDKEKFDYMDTIYIANDAEEVEVDAPNFDDYVDGVMSEINSRINENPDLSEDVVDENSTSSLNIDEVSDDSAVANDEVMFEELQKLLKQNSELEKKVVSLNEKLSVCYAKEAKSRIKVEALKTSVSKLTEKANSIGALKTKIDKLNEELTDKNSSLQQLTEKLNKNINARKSLNEEVEQNKESINSLKEQLRTSNNTVDKLNEEVVNLKKDLQLNKSSYTKQLEKSKQLVEKYKKITTNVVNKYIDSQALKLGVSSNEIKNKLPESYSIKDIDVVCEEVRDYRINMSKLPFTAMTSNLNEEMKFKAKASQNELLGDVLSAQDDFVDDQLMSLLEKK